MASKEDKEAAINARIAAIRAANEARERRHREVEADRLAAERNKSAVTVKTEEEQEDEKEDRFKSPFDASKAKAKKPVHERLASKPPPPRDEANSGRRGRGRLADDDGPPPDPGYSFLADRMRDGSPVEDERGQKATKNPRAKKEPLLAKKSGGRERLPTDENVSPKHKMNRNKVEEKVAQNIREIREETARGHAIKPLMPESRLNSGAVKSGGGGAQARLDRSRNNQQMSSSNENGSDTFPSEPWKCPDPGCCFTNRPRMMRCAKCGLDWEKAVLHNPNRKVIETGKKNITVKVQFDRSEEEQTDNKIEHLEHQPQAIVESQPPSVAPTPLVASTPSWTPNDNSQWQPMPINQWDPQTQAAQPQPQSQPMVIGHWENPGMGWSQPMTDWSGAAAEPSPDYHHHQQSLYSQQFMHIPFQDTSNPMMIPMGGHNEYMAPHPNMVHHGHQAMTQITHATMPIMATQQYIPPAPKENYYGRGYSRPSNGGRGGGSQSWRNPEKEVTRIPPRFQKQRPAHQHQASEKAMGLPRATSRNAPETARRLTIFGTSNVVNNMQESDLSEQLNIPVRIIPAMKLDVFKEKIGEVDPEQDRLVLIHGLGNDARNIALKTSKNDVDKGAESDGMANEFADVVLDLVERIPYVKVLISTLLPRFDNEEQMNMSNPNNVRKVMNVEISMRLQDKPNIEFINNDTVLEWWKDDVKKLRLFRSDGYHLSAYGFSTMLEHWMKALKTSVAQLSLVETDDSTSPDGDNDDSVFSPPPPPSIQQPPKEAIIDENKTLTSEKKEASSAELSDGELPQLETVVANASSLPKMETTEKVPPLPNSDEDEFHEASESPSEVHLVEAAAGEAEEEPKEAVVAVKDEEEFKEKSNEEKMEKEMKHEDAKDEE